MLGPRPSCLASVCTPASLRGPVFSAGPALQPSVSPGGCVLAVSPLRLQRDRYSPAPVPRGGRPRHIPSCYLPALCRHLRSPSSLPHWSFLGSAMASPSPCPQGPATPSQTQTCPELGLPSPPGTPPLPPSLRPHVLGAALHTCLLDVLGYLSWSRARARVRSTSPCFDASSYREMSNLCFNSIIKICSCNLRRRRFSPSMGTTQ